MLLGCKSKSRALLLLCLCCFLIFASLAEGQRKRSRVKRQDDTPVGPDDTTEPPADTEAPTDAPADTEAPTDETTTETEATTTEAAAEAETEAPTETEAPATDAPADTEAPAETEATTKAAATTKAPSPTTAKPSPTSKPSTTAAATSEPDDGASGDIDEDWQVDISIDPFPTSKKWQHFVIRAESILSALRNLAATLSNSLTDKNQDFASNKTGFTDNFESNFAALWEPLDEFFKPLNDQLYESAPFLEVNPAIGLQQLEPLLAFAKANPTGKRDLTRLKWIEIMSFAIQSHHTFDRLRRSFKQDGLEEIADAVNTEYPSWKIVNVQNESFVTTGYELISPEKMIDHIHVEFDAMGEKNQLLRGLERILRKNQLEWNPRKTDLNKYCYGSNKFATIHDTFDMLTDAALYLIMADMKFALFQTALALYTGFQANKQGPVDISGEFEKIMESCVTRINKKIKLGGEPPAEPIADGALLMNCDPPPEILPPCYINPEDPEVTIKDGEVYIGTTKAKIDEQTKQALYENGTVIPGIEGVKKYVRSADKSAIVNSEIMYTVNEKGEILDKNNTVQTDIEQIVTYAIYTKLPKAHSDDRPMITPDGEWGKLNCTNDTSPTPRYEPQCGPPDQCPYDDPRPPHSNQSDFAITFKNAYSGYLEAEVVLNPKGKCVGTCPDYKRRASVCDNTDHCKDLRHTVCEQGVDCLAASKCSTSARRCERTSPEVTFCPSTKNDSRLYDWINVGGEIRSVLPNILANATGENPQPPCDNPVMKATERWIMENGVILDAPQYCEVCLCVCDDPMFISGQHVVDLTEAASRVGEGYVVTAIRFEQDKENNIMRLNIEEGKLLANGEIDQSTLKWLEREPVDKADETKSISLGSKGFRKMNLDIVYAQTDQVITGLKFVKFGDDSLTISAQLTKIDKTTSLLPESGAQSEWKEPYYPDPKPRKTIVMNDVQSPLSQLGPSQPYDLPTNSKAVEFDATSLKKDGGQAVVPFFDFQAAHAATVSRKALQGAGIIYKSKRESGGYLAPVVVLFEKPY